ncbi:MAG: hypothetical protein AAF556_06085, partial [Pseudomonadota bacterium]
AVLVGDALMGDVRLDAVSDACPGLSVIIALVIATTASAAIIAPTRGHATLMDFAGDGIGTAINDQPLLSVECGNACMVK